MVGDRIDILTSGGTKFATGYVERVDPIYTVLRTDTGTPVTINNKVCRLPLRDLNVEPYIWPGFLDVSVVSSAPRLETTSHASRDPYMSVHP